MSLIPVSSSNLAAIGYNPFAAVLTVVFHGDRAYEFFHVPVSVFWELMRAESHGKYFHAAIRDRYPCRRLQ